MDKASRQWPSELGDQLVREGNWPSRFYVGPLSEAKRVVTGRCDEVKGWRSGDVHGVSTRRRGPDGVERFAAATAGTAEAAWRLHIGCMFGEEQPFPDDALPGESPTQMQARLGDACEWARER